MPSYRVQRIRDIASCLIFRCAAVQADFAVLLYELSHGSGLMERLARAVLIRRYGTLPSVRYTFYLVDTQKRT